MEIIKFLRENNRYFVKVDFWNSGSWPLNNFKPNF